MKYLLPEESINQLDEGLCVLYFYSSWMKFHKRFDYMINSYENKNNNFNFFAVDVDYHKDLCKRLGVECVPLIIILFDNKEIKRCEGLLLSSAFKAALNDIYDKYKEKINVK